MRFVAKQKKVADSEGPWDRTFISTRNTVLSLWLGKPQRAPWPNSQGSPRRPSLLPQTPLAARFQQDTGMSPPKPAAPATSAAAEPRQQDLPV